jgi:hypothetical protein
MIKRYPWIGVTLLAGLLFAGFYVCTFFATAASYSFYFDRPADQSREIAWIYYGVAFSTVPYLLLGSFLYAYARQKKLRLALHAVVVAMFVEKAAIVYLATLLATGFPWYGRGFPGSGHALLCEELPMFCGSEYVLHYHLWSPLLALGAFYAGTRMVRRKIDKAIDA